ncbi:MAG: hypothetical protein CFE43_07855 [Burkholderiales bacterium PBB3]|nr:MAG: hypothetical protein CFE43_07855 [Burkholderiales bacterium PBB3]
MNSGHSVESGNDKSIFPIWACVVCYLPDLQTLERLVSVLSPQVERVLLMDNSPGPLIGVESLLAPKVAYLKMPGNLGTAGALNRGWALAIEAGAGAVVSFDQDSTVTGDLVTELARNYQKLCSDGQVVAAIGPRIVDPRSGRPARIRHPQKLFRFHKVACVGPPVAVDHLISSGSLVPASSFRAVGEFSELLFLDYVDIEWSLRARMAGYSVYVVPGLFMNHTIGDKILSLGGRSLPIHKPFRTYLLIRNHLLLWRSPAAKLFWLLSDFRQLVAKLIILLIIQPQRLLRLRLVLLGMWHGIAGLGGGPKNFGE